MLKLNNIRLIRFEPEYHTAKLYEWYYSGEYQEFFRDSPECPAAVELARAAQYKAFMIAKDDEIVGMIGAHEQNDVSRNFTIGILIDVNHQASKCGFQALQIYLNWKFNHCNFYKSRMKILANNQRLCNSLNAFGATREGGHNASLKKESFFDGKFHDIAVYAMFKTEFNKLYSHNFQTKETRLESRVPGDSNG